MKAKPKNEDTRLVFGVVGAFLGSILAIPALFIIVTRWYGLPVLILCWLVFWYIEVRVSNWMRRRDDQSED